MDGSTSSSLSRSRPWAAPTGVGLAIAGGAWLGWSTWWLCRRGRGWPISHLPPRRLVRGGPYAAVRHPIYLGYTVAFSGAGFLAGSLGRGLGAAGFLTAGWLLYALGFEEPRLLRRHGVAYSSFRRGTPLLLPRLPAAWRRWGIAALSSLWSAGRVPLEKLANRTVLCRSGPVLWVTYGALMAAGAALMGCWIAGLLIGAGFPAGRATAYLLGLGAAIPVGGRLVWLAYRWRALLKDPYSTLRTVGFVSWGGLLAMAGFPAVFGFLTGTDPLWLMDRTLLPSLVCLALGRLGCLSYGCCYGRRSEWGIRWTCPDAKVIREGGDDARAPRVPTQLLEAVLGAAILPVAVAATEAGAPPGAATGLVLLLYSLGRFASDLLREEVRFGRWGFTSGQIGSGLAFLFATSLLLTVNGPSGWERSAIAVGPAAVAETWPAIVAVTLLVAVVCGFHWRRVGSWG